jgi:bifunctional non-homologous end joining protein LigD
VGHSGSGFNAQSLKEVYGKLKKLVTTKCPFRTVPKTNQPATWVKPELVCEIKLSEWTKEGIARHPIFMGLRTDKKPTDVVMEKEKHLSAETIKGRDKKMTNTKSKPVKKTARTLVNKKKTTGSKKGVKTSGQEIDLASGKDQIISIDGHELKLTNLDKLYWKKEKFTKGDMLNYYLKVAPYMLPYMMDRPQSLNRHPNGIAGSSFYQKDVEGKVAEWIKTFPIHSESNNETIEYLVCNNESTLIYMANLGCIEMNPWHSRYQNYEKPDWCLIDLDPDTPNTFEQVIEVAIVVKEVLDSIGADSYPKTSGSTGIHIYIPLGGKYSYDQSKQLAELIVHLVHHEMLSITSLERSPAKRKGKIYLDYLQNRLAQTAAAPYSLRPKPGVPVSTPLDWSEVKKGLTPTTYTAYNLFDRLKTEGDLFNGVLGKGIDMKKVLEKLQALFR